MVKTFYDYEGYALIDRPVGNHDYFYGGQDFFYSDDKDYMAYTASAEDLQEVDIDRGVTQLVDLCYKNSQEAGWWTENFNVAEKICLMHSELSEALEADRKGLMDDKLPHRKGIEVELADAVIRIADLAGKLELDLGGAIIEKLQYNKTREDHKIENRMKDGGKKY